MHRLCFWIVLLAFFSSCVPAFGGSHSGIPVTRWVSPGNEHPLSFREWLSQRPKPVPWSIRPTAKGTGKAPKLDIIVQDSLADSLSCDLLTYRVDLANQGFSVSQYSATGTEPESLRAFLQQEYAGGLVGVVLVGDLPVAWYQMIDDFNGNGGNDGYEEFPIELFFMDLNGTWTDSLQRYGTQDSLVPGSDGIYDTRSGDLGPEIFLGRLIVNPTSLSIPRLRNYFQKDHAYRAGTLPVPDSALVYVDDDWEPWAGEWSGNVGLTYPVRTTVSDPETTRATDYVTRFPIGYQWISVFAHSWPGGHAFKYNNGNSWEYLYASQINGLDPQALFYNLFACSNARFVENGYMGGEYLYAPTWGLGAVGTCKTGSMLDFDQFYGPMASQATIGEAFRDWFAYEASQGFPPDARSWFYGMALLGDPALKPHTMVNGVAMEESPGEPRPFAGIRVSPNPFLSGARIHYQLAQEGRVRASVYDPLGRRIRTLLDAPQTSGPQELIWDGRDDRGREVRPGTYFLRVSGAGVNRTSRLVHLR